MGRKPFIDRKAAKHYHVVHRSQRDPLINDEESSERVLKEVIPSNLAKHKTKEELESVHHKPQKLTQDQIDQRVGQAALHGIYYDDSEYDYMQHLKPIGATNAVFLEAPKKEKAKVTNDLAFRDDDNGQKNRQLIELPAGVLPSDIERDVGAMAHVSGLEGGLQPDMDPRLREVLEALDDEEYVEEGLDEEFFGNLNAEGDIYVPEEEDDEEYYEDEEEEEEVEEIYDEDGSYDWQAAFRNFQRDQRRAGSDDEYEDDDRDERQSRSTGFSMSSSAMHRNAQLRLLDDRFDKIEEEYMDDDDEDEEEDREERGDFDAILDDFLDKYELVGNRMAVRLEGETSGQKLDTVRNALLATKLSDDEDEKGSVSESLKPKKEKVREAELWERPVQRQRQAWDCQSVISTYSNLENHPEMISDRGPKKKITIDPKTGLPVLVEVERKQRRKDNDGQEDNESLEEEEEEEEEDEDEDERPNLGVARTKQENKDEKKARKQAVKEAKKNRREEKKSTKKAFKNEESRQSYTVQQKRATKGVTHIP
ncbi:hypothetical protein DFQ28_008493 [Apophysomyces sp. BC1034]|nr:hypothetical protein DFQ30_009288 [Apophysomyces sp. BC1015]KAG0181816.1 hypothetical protein DFQ29_006927 [Apophysomyces sp. BC1021]KAG0192617.1 hypothetical protein DFQ28_008493 [Apophysomyces sp. BC1034]